MRVTSCGDHSVETSMSPTNTSVGTSPRQAPMVFPLKPCQSPISSARAYAMRAELRAGRPIEQRQGRNPCQRGPLRRHGNGQAETMLTDPRVVLSRAGGLAIEVNPRRSNSFVSQCRAPIRSRHIIQRAGHGSRNPGVARSR